MGGVIFRATSSASEANQTTRQLGRMENREKPLLGNSLLPPQPSGSPSDFDRFPPLQSKRRPTPTFPEAL